MNHCLFCFNAMAKLFIRICISLFMENSKIEKLRKQSLYAI